MSSKSSSPAIQPASAAIPARRAAPVRALAAAAIAVMALTGGLSAAAEARGWGGGHHSGGVRLVQFHSPMRLHSSHSLRFRPAFVVRRHVFEPKHVVRRHEPAAHVAHWKQKRHTLRVNHVVRNDDDEQAPAVRKAKVQRTITPLQQVAVAPKPPKLSPAQYQNASVTDDQGRRYDASKKMWFDGKNWWRGEWAWLLVDGAWRYGNRPWTQVDGRWTTDGPNPPRCVDCDAPAAEPAKAADANADEKAGEDAAPENGNDQADLKKVAAIAEDAVPAAAAATANAGSGDATAPAAGPDAGPAAGPAAECRQFVPAIGMTIAVPCSD